MSLTGTGKNITLRGLKGKASAEGHGVGVGVMIFYIVLSTELTWHRCVCHTGKGCAELTVAMDLVCRTGKDVQNSQWLWTLEGNDQNSDLSVVWSGIQNYLWGHSQEIEFCSLVGCWLGKVGESPEWT